MSTDELSRRLDPPLLAVERYPWSLTLADDELINICWRGVRLLSGIRVLVRDSDWRTVSNRVTNVNLIEGADLVRMTVDIETAGYGVDFATSLVVEMSSELLEASFVGRAAGPFSSNRIGFVVLHPAELAGESVAVEHVDGSESGSCFPVLISPHQPFQNIAAMRWNVGGVAARLGYEGDVFETEDQRNWTDASYKTYSRPLDLPFPFTVDEGEVFEQRLVLSAEAAAEIDRGTEMTPADRVVIGDEIGAVVPAVSTAARKDDSSGPIGSDFDFPCLLAEIDPTAAGWSEALDLAIDDAAKLGAALDLRLILKDAAQGAVVLDRVEGVPLVRLGVFDRDTHMTEPVLWEWICDQITSRGLDAELVAGTRAHFTELNRTRDLMSGVLAQAQGASFSVTPQMHSTEVRHIVSSLSTQVDVVRSAESFLGSTPIHVGPITLASRFNAVATTPGGGSLEMPPDALTSTPFAAAWVIGSVAALSNAGVSSLSYFTLDDLERTRAGEVLTQLSKLAGLPILGADSSGALDLGIFAVAAAGGPRVFVANLSRAARDVLVEWPDGDAHAVSLEPWSHKMVDHGEVRAAD